MAYLVSMESFGQGIAENLELDLSDSSQNASKIE